MFRRIVEDWLAPSTWLEASAVILFLLLILVAAALGSGA